MKKIIAVVIFVFGVSACKKDVVTTTPTGYTFDKSLFPNHWWYTDYSRTSGFAEYKGRYFGSDSSLLVDRNNYGLGIADYGKPSWWWGDKDSLFGLVHGCIKNLTKDSLTITWDWSTFGGTTPTSFTAYYYR